MPESRGELLAWMNNLTASGFGKVEQCGSGSAYCHIIDSIYRDLPMTKVKFNSKQEYEYLQNYKILQAAFDKHKIANRIPVQQLVKCKMQDNLEFLQWLKKFWDTNYPGGSYDPLSRRKGLASTSKPPGTASGAIAAIPATGLVAAGLAQIPPEAQKAMRRASKANQPKDAKGVPGSGDVSEFVNAIAALNQQNLEIKAAAGQIEKEREFYFGKLRAIEVLVQQFFDLDPVPADSSTYMKDIQTILYQTEDGFELPEVAE